MVDQAGVHCRVQMVDQPGATLQGTDGDQAGVHCRVQMVDQPGATLQGTDC